MDQTARPPRVTRLAPGLTRVIAPNPSPFTLWGTNSYLVGEGEGVALIDPGPDQPDHRAALMEALGPGQRITHILVTHAHSDHAPLAAPLARETGARVHAFGPWDAGRSAVMRALAEAGYDGGGEGMDRGFAPDVELADGAVVEGDGWRLTAMWTPGHCGNHLCFLWPGPREGQGEGQGGETCFSGDLVMGWATSIVSPPDGDLTDFMASCRRLQARAPARLWPGHGDPVDDPAARIAWLIAHREAREAAILGALAGGEADVAAITARVYTDVAPALRPAAARNVFAHLVDLHGKNRVTARPALHHEATFSLT